MLCSPSNQPGVYLVLDDIVLGTVLDGLQGEELVLWLDQDDDREFWGLCIESCEDHESPGIGEIEVGDDDIEFIICESLDPLCKGWEGSELGGSSPLGLGRVVILECTIEVFGFFIFLGYDELHGYLFYNFIDFIIV